MVLGLIGVSGHLVTSRVATARALDCACAAILRLRMGVTTVLEIMSR